MDAFIQHLQTRLKGPLPGTDAHHRMAHPFRPTVIPAPGGASLAGVLALFFPKNQAWQLALIERVSTHSADRHSGQIGFPGGKYEAGDGILMNTALRETHEEVGVAPKEVNMLGALTEIYIPVSNFLVHPFVGWMDYAPAFQPQWSEVQSVLEVPFSVLEDPDTLQTTDIQVTNNLTIKEVPYFNVSDKVVWGATAMILSELLEVASRRPQEHT
ncbi:MAG: CoA pyrophosphatase [Saprospiraceae bacterium]|nr:CoA pyrophosphatase [Saprospiraceae bacterium]MDZ4705874.1 CoA pyrophosphatase [Saprospiraceae bacterium]